MEKLNVQDLWDTIKRPDIPMLGYPIGVDRELECTFSEILTTNFLLGKIVTLNYRKPAELPGELIRKDLLTHCSQI